MSFYLKQFVIVFFFFCIVLWAACLYEWCYKNKVSSSSSSSSLLLLVVIFLLLLLLLLLYWKLWQGNTSFFDEKVCLKENSPLFFRAGFINFYESCVQNGNFLILYYTSQWFVESEWRGCSRNVQPSLFLTLPVSIALSTKQKILYPITLSWNKSCSLQQRLMSCVLMNCISHESVASLGGLNGWGDVVKLLHLTGWLITIARLIQCSDLRQVAEKTPQSLLQQCTVRKDWNQSSFRIYWAKRSCENTWL